jgi:hypothetical protein
MNDSDVGYSYEWEYDFSGRLKVNKKPNSASNDVEMGQGYPEIKKNYSENFILQNFFDEN